MALSKLPDDPAENYRTAAKLVAQMLGLPVADFLPGGLFEIALHGDTLYVNATVYVRGHIHPVICECVLTPSEPK